MGVGGRLSIVVGALCEAYKAGAEMAVGEGPGYRGPGTTCLALLSFSFPVLCTTQELPTTPGVPTYSRTCRIAGAWRSREWTRDGHVPTNGQRAAEGGPRL